MPTQGFLASARHVGRQHAEIKMVAEIYCLCFDETLEKKNPPQTFPK